MRLYPRMVIAAALSLPFCACDSSSSPSKASGLEDFVAGTGAVKLGMTEEEVIRALGAQPERRRENGRQTEMAFKLPGAVPGTAYASFLGGPLTVIEFSLARIDDPPLPRVSKEDAWSLSLGALARKAIDHTLEMTDVLEATGTPGRRVTWKLFRRFDGGRPRTAASTTRFWEVEPGGKVLIVVETDGKLDQPFVRDLPRP